MMTLRLTRAVKVLLIACIATFFVQQTIDRFFSGNLIAWLGLVPQYVVFDFRLWQLFTYSFLHGDVMHLALNMLMLVFIGSELETLWGTARFLRYYFVCVVSAGVLYLLLQMLVWGGDALLAPMVGASGGIYGLLMAYGILFGERTLLFMMLFPMKAKHFVWVLAAVEFTTSLFSGRNGLAAAAHLGGMVAGFGYLWTRAAINVRKRARDGKGKSGKPGRTWAKKRSGGHLKLIINNEKNRSDRAEDSSGPSGPKTWH